MRYATAAMASIFALTAGAATAATTPPDTVPDMSQAQYDDAGAMIDLIADRLGDDGAEGALQEAIENGGLQPPVTAEPDTPMDEAPALVPLPGAGLMLLGGLGVLAVRRRS